MTKNLTIIGNSLGLILDKAILELLCIDKDTPLEITTNGTSLTITPQAKETRDRFVTAKKRVLKTHAETFRKLAK